MTDLKAWDYNRWARPARQLTARAAATNKEATYESHHLVVTERDLFFDVSLFQHPFTGTLQRRLQRGSTAGLLAADTKYLDTKDRLAGTIEGTINTGKKVGLPADARPLLAGTAEATTANGQNVSLAAGLRLQLPGPAEVTTAGTFRVLLDESYPAELRKSLTPPAGAAASVIGDNVVTVDNGFPITLIDGANATLPGGTNLTLSEGFRITLPANSTVTVEAAHRIPALYQRFFEGYAPAPAVRRPYPVRDLDFSTSGPYSLYNWELFYHIPLTIALHLSRNQRFAEAQQWLHCIFDPTDNSDEPTPDRFWKVKPFQTTKVRKIEELLANLATGADRRLREDTVASIEAWRANPFRPHLVARFRQDAYMYRAVTAYLDNLIAWGDALFNQDTGEAVDEALSHYMLAAAILGLRPQRIPDKGSPKRQTYADLQGDLSEFGAVLRRIEPDLPFNLLPFPRELSTNDERAVVLRGIGTTLYFCVPRSDKLLRYWSTVEDRLFKIRNSLNLQGVFRQLALFDPPIDPALLARAVAAGVDISAVVSGLQQPLPLVRFQLLLQKANELCQDVKALGSGLLSAIEKEDGEAIAVLRSHHERATLSLSEQITYGRIQEAIKAREAVEASLHIAVERYVLLERQLGKPEADILQSLPNMDDLDVQGLRQMRFKAEEPNIEPPHIELDIAPSIDRPAGKIVSSFEAQEIKKSAEARSAQDISKGLALTAQILDFIPDFGVDLQFWGLGGDAGIFGGTKLARALRLGADIANWAGDWLNWEASQAGKIGGYARRQSDLEQQSAAAARDITKTYKDLRAAQIREAVATQELENVRNQIRQSAEIHYFLTGEKGDNWPSGANAKSKKFTNQGFYAWMRRETRGLYTQCYQLALDTARKAERALQHELGDPSITFIKGAYMAGNEGLLSGERLQLDLRRMELAYLELNRRELELTKRVSLMQIDPQALVELRTKGECSFHVPEALYDFGGAGQYFRRIKSVAVSIPCVASDYAGVNCTLTLVDSTIRMKPDLVNGDDPYARDPNGDDDRFSAFTGVSQTIATSAALNDSGLFEPNLRDERYLPFEYAGAECTWRLTLPGDPSAGDPLQFDYNTITDVILHVRYTARYGGERLRRDCLKHLNRRMADERITRRLFSVRYDFPAVWAQLDDSATDWTIKFTPEDIHFPFFAQPDFLKLKNDDKNVTSVTATAVLAPAGGKTLTTTAVTVATNPERVPGKGFSFTLEKAATERVLDVWVIIEWNPQGTDQ